jgi:glutaredoxin 3
MAKIEIYTTPFCPFCVRAKALLKRKGIDFEEIDVTMVPGAREEMLERSGGRRTVPQIFIDGDGIGGSDELHVLESQGDLDRKLAS